MQDKQITALILAGTEMGGMGGDYFENKTRHVLPIANKPLIQHLIETLDNKRIGDRYIKIEEKIEKNERKKPGEKVYNLIFGDVIKLVGQDSLTQVGTFGAVRRFMDKDMKDDEKKDVFPLLILYGDTLVEENFLKHIIAQYDKEQKESKIVWGLIKHKKERGDVVTEPIDITKDKFKEIDEKNIINIFEQQRRTIESYDLLHDTGIMLISKDAWDVIYKLIEKIHRPSNHGIFSFTSILRQALAFKDIDIEGFGGGRAIKIISCVASEDCWSEANYPWEILDINEQKISDFVKDAVLTYEEEKAILIKKDTVWTEEKEKEIKERYLFCWDNVPGSDSEKLIMFLRDEFCIDWAKNAEIRKLDDGKSIRIFKDKNSAEIMINEMEENATLKISDGRTHDLNVKKENSKLKIFGEKIILVQSDVILSMSNGARIKGPCFLGKKTEIKAFTLIENSYIGDSCNIGAHTLILDSTLVKDVKVNPDAVIEKSIIMENSVICYHAEVLHSIIGKEVMIGSDVKTPCQRLKKVDEAPKYQYVTYFSDLGIKRTMKFGAIVGDYCQIGSGTVIHPGRRIGKRSKIYANCEILKNIKPHSEIRNKDIVERYD